MGLLDVLFEKMETKLDEGKKVPEIKEIEREISRYERFIITGYDGISDEINKEIRRKRFEEYKRKKIALQYQSDAERIRRGMKPKYYTYTKDQEKALLKKFLPYELESQKPKVYRDKDGFLKTQKQKKYEQDLWRCAEQIGIKFEEIDAEKERINKLRQHQTNFHLPISDAEVLENIILEKTKNSKIKNDFVEYVKSCIIKRKWEEEHREKEFYDMGVWTETSKLPQFPKMPKVNGCDIDGFLKKTRKGR